MGICLMFLFSFFEVNWYFRCTSPDVDDCVGVTCSDNGVCKDRVNGYKCNCKPGFFGLNCEIGRTN